MPLGVPSEWARAVLHGTLGALGRLAERSGGKLEATVLAAWLDGEFAYVVYRKTGQRGTFGYWFDTHEGYTGSLQSDPDAVGYEHALLAIHEPHWDSPEADIERGCITWWDSPGPDVPVWPDEIPPKGASVVAGPQDL